jgi:hypothetical protein
VSYNVYMSMSLAGAYMQINNAPIEDTKVRLPNIRFNSTVYFKVTAVNAAGEESALSDASQDATCNPGTVTLEFTGLVGDQIPAGAMFTAQVGARLVSFITTSSGVCN